ncbi:MAG: hypothetical protein IKG25_04325 [Mogibacterium sp.]|nr:hypothetical protein [Mogibacterium sp.]
MKQGYWIVRTYEAGIVGEKTKYWVKGDRPSGKSRRKERAEIRKQEQNEYSAIKRMARLINANFSEGDLLIGLDYSPAGMEKLEAWAREQKEARPEAGGEEDMLIESAWHEAVLCLRRVAREMKKDGFELRYIAITSDMDGKTGEKVRVHHHLVVNREAGPYFARKWEKLGTVDWETMSKQADYTPLAEYFIKQVRRIPDADKFRSSRNLIRPQPKDRIVTSDAELRVPKGGKLLFRQEQRRYGGVCYQPQYIRYIIPPEKRKICPPQAGGEAET